MSDQLFERAVHDWLEDGSDRTPPAAIDAVLLAVKTTPQERDLRIPRRYTVMPTYLRLAAGIAIVAVLGLGALLYVNRGTGPRVGGEPTPSPTLAPAAAPSPTAAAAATLGPLDTTAWTTFTSSEYGFSVGHPPNWTVVPATRGWSFATDAEIWLSSAEDAFLAPDRSVRAAAWAVPLTDPQMNQSWPELEAWVIDYCQQTKNTDCATIHDRAVPLCVEKRDCHPALLVPFADDVQAFGYGGVLPAGKMVVVTIARGETDPNVAPYGGATRLLEAFLSTMDIWPPFYPEAQDAAATFAATGR
jgi:hypothetical protein